MLRPSNIRPALPLLLTTLLCALFVAACNPGAEKAQSNYASRDAFLSKLSEKVSASELAVAKTYVAN